MIVYQPTWPSYDMKTETGDIGPCARQLVMTDGKIWRNTARSLRQSRMLTTRP